MSNRSSELLCEDEGRPTGWPASYEIDLHALTSALQTAFEAAVFPDWFEIDEQAPGSRIDALTEALILQLQGLRRRNRSNQQDIGGILPLISVIQHIGNNMRILSNKA